MEKSIRMTPIKYFEVEFDKTPRGADWDENCTGDYSICILAEREPSREEAAIFCKSDMEKMGYKYVVGITEISKEEAYTFFDMEDAEKRYPVFK